MLSDRRVLALILVLVMGAIVAAGVVVAPKFLGDDTPEAEADAQAFLDAWGEGDLEAMAARIQDAPATFAEDYTAVTEGLAVESADYELGNVRRSGDIAIATFDAHMRITGVGEWSYGGRMRLEHNPEAADGDPEWLVKWTPATIHPDLEADQRLRSTREWPERGAINGSDGKPLAPTVPGRIVGLQPNAIQDLNAVKLALQAELGVTPAEVDEALNAPGVQPDHFVPIITITEDVYDAHEAVIYPLPGTRFRETSVRSGPTAGYAQHVLGRTGEATAERLEELGAPYMPGDVVGTTGLEARYEKALAGTPSSEIQVLGGADEVLATLDTVEGRAPVAIDTTIDRSVQTAVERSLEGVTKPAAIVVTDAKGNVRAAASRPLDEDLNRAFGGAYPPGSTFKVVTTDALLGNGVTPDTTVNCPQTANVGGKSFRNFEGGQLGAIPFRQAFAESCNTAFVTAVEDVPDDQAVAAAERFGFNAEYSLGLNTVGGSYPAPADTTEKAAQAIGQGRVTASPLHMATVAGAVMDGSWEAPTLLVDPPADEAPTEDGEAASDPTGGTAATEATAGGSTTTAATGDGDGAAARPTTIDAGHRQELAGLMRLVVSEGSGKNAAAPGHDVGGKTGTAEFGDAPPLPTHAWFIGFSDNLSFAVFLEDGGVGGRDAAPIAGRMVAGF
jgi:cell division protein FtsI/penicillin-binding protein 2